MGAPLFVVPVFGLSVRHQNSVTRFKSEKSNSQEPLQSPPLLTDSSYDSFVSEVVAEAQEKITSSEIKPEIASSTPASPFDFAEDAGEQAKAKAKPKGKFWLKAAKVALGLEFLAGSLFGVAALKNYQNSKRDEQTMITLGEPRLSMDVPRIQWPKNTKVYASTIQETSAWLDSEGSMYTRNLVERLKRPEYKSLDEAHLSLEKGLPNPRRAFNGISQVPVSSPVPATSWQKDDPRARFVLIVVGDGLGGESDFYLEGKPSAERVRYDQDFFAEALSLKHTLQEQYQLPEHRIKLLSSPSRGELLDAMAWLGEKGDRFPGVEALVMMIGHGAALTAGDIAPPQRHMQGAKFGIMGLNATEDLDEAQLKLMSERYLSGFKGVSVIMAPCHSGAWISQAPVRGNNNLFSQTAKAVV